MRVIVRASLWREAEFQFPFTVEQTRLLGELVASCKAQGDNTMGRYQKFLWSLFSFVDQPDRNLIQHLTAIMALREDGSFNEATDSTADLAKLKYWIRVTVLLQALCFSDESESSKLQCVSILCQACTPTDDLAMHRLLQECHSAALKLGVQHAFNMVHEMQAAASSAALMNVRLPNVYWDPDYSAITVGRYRVTLNAIRAGLSKMEQDIADRYLRLTNGQWYMSGVDVDDIPDDLSDSERGVSYGSKLQFQDLHSRFFLNIVGDNDLACTDGSGSLMWNLPALKDMLRRTGELWKIFNCYLFITVPISMRGMQFLEIAHGNHDRLRNVFFPSAGELLITTGRSKHMGQEKSIPMYASPFASRFLLELLCGGLRAVESHFAETVYGERSKLLYSTYVELLLPWHLLIL